MKRPLEARWRSAFVLTAIALALGCQGCTPPVTLKTVDMNPKSAGTGLSGVSGSYGACFSVGNIPPTPFSPGNGQVMVGFDNFYRAGTHPFPCDDVRAALFRAGVLFDVSQFDHIVIADLLFDTQASISRSGGNTTSSTSVATTLGLSTGPFTGPLPDDDEASIAGLTGSIDEGVTAQVRDWTTNAHPNYGFVIGGPTGPVNPDSFPENNDAKVSWYGNFRLRVVYNPALNPRAPQ